MNHNLIGMLATHCCVCRQSLTDAESVELGLGPICSRRYYNPLHRPTEEMVQSALGMLFSSELPDHVIDAFRNLVSTDHTNARKACNLLIYYASCMYHDKDEVFKCSRVIRELGYIELADKLEIDRTELAVVVKPDAILVSIPNRYMLVKDMMRIPGAVNTGTKNGHKVNWTVPVTQKSYLDAVLGVHLGGKLACGTKADGTTGIWHMPRKRWDDLQAARNAANPQKVMGVQPPQVQLHTTPSSEPEQDVMVVKNGKLTVRTPYKAEFKDDLKAAIPYDKRKWNGVDKCWEIDLAYEQKVRDLLLTHFSTITA